MMFTTLVNRGNFSEWRTLLDEQPLNKGRCPDFVAFLGLPSMVLFIIAHCFDSKCGLENTTKVSQFASN